jgi:diguanylate cyclase (GGDEF)-like protein
MEFRSMLRGVGGSRGAHRSGAGKDQVVAPHQLDVADRLQMLDALEDTGVAWFWATDAECRLVYLSPSALRNSGRAEAPAGVLLSELLESVQLDGAEATQRPLNFLLNARSRFAEQVFRLKGEGAPAYWSMSGRPHFDGGGTFLGFRGSARDVSATYQQQIDAARLAEFDSLTGLSNRHRMGRRLAAKLDAYRHAKRSCALLMLDLDRFKQVNDTLGHPAGDELLRQVAQRLERIAPSGSDIGRLGGDEFQLILPDIEDRGRLGELALRLIQMLSQPYSIDGARAIIGTSIGIAIAPYDGITPEELVKSADLALYAAKGSGRGQYRFFSNELQDIAHERRQVEEDLHDALARGELEVHYQPVIRSRDSRVGGFEALVRWTHPKLGPISPAVFMPIAEDANMMGVIGEWVLRQACKDASHWPEDVRVAVNISASQFVNDGLAAIVANALAASGLSPGRLELEVTEGVFMGDTHEVDQMFARLKRIGVKLALDDFGTGYSSLGYLRRAPFDKIKIDQGFVRGCTEKDNTNSAIITAIISLANALSMETTAEGVETLDELALVSGLGATNIQGYVYSPAVAQGQVMDKFASGDLVYRPGGPARQRAERRTVLRHVGVIHEDHHYTVTLRNLSRSGALIDGLLDVPVGTDMVLDIGEGQLAVCTVRRSHMSMQGIEFETPLISNGADGLCTRHRINPYILAAAGMPLRALPSGNYQQHLVAQQQSRPKFLQVDTGANNRGG